jgi:large repetitive protein
VTFAATGLSGGVGGFEYSWSGLPTGCAPANAANLSCTPTGPGAFTVDLTVTDSDGLTTTATVGFSVYPPPMVSAPRPSTTSVVEGRSFGLAVSLTGGSGDVAYLWSGLPTGCSTVNASTLTCTPSTNGTFSVAVTVRDSNGVSATGPALSLTVARPTTAPVPLEEVVLIGSIAAIAVVAIAIAVRSRKKPPVPPE